MAALALWRGAPLVDADGLSAVAAELGRLHRLHLRALEELADVQLRLGRNDAVIELLRVATREFPHHEPFAEQLMLALYRSGRQPEALGAFNEFARRVDERGLRPSARLRQLEIDVLLQKSHLDPAGPAELAEAVMARSAHARPVGRRDELRQLLDARARAAGGERGFVLLSGPAGIGKTTLAAEFCERARRLGASVFEAACRADDDGGFEALGEMLAAMTGLREQLGSDLEALCHQARRSGAEPGLGNREIESDQLRLFDAMAAAIRAGADQPVVILVEDLHWAGSATLSALRHLLRVADLPTLLVVGTVRDEDLDAERKRLVTGLAPVARTVRLPLAGLDDHETRSLVRAVAGSGGAVIDVAEKIRDATQGNPFFIHALLRDLAEQPAGDRSQLEARIAGAAPSGVRSLIDRSVGRVSNDARAVLEVAAVVGGDLPLDLLEAVAELPHHRVVEASDELVEARLLVEIAAYVDRFAFSHALVRNAVYMSVAEPRRRSLHARVAEVLERAADGVGARAVQVAHHYYAATTIRPDRRAAEWAERAGAEAAHRFAFAEAADWYDCALELGGDAGPPGGGVTYLALGLAADGAHQAERARAAYLAGADRAREHGDAALLADIAIAAAPAWTSGLEPAAAVEALLVDALDALGTSDPSRRIQLLARFATLVHYTDPDHQRRLVDEACALARSDVRVDAHAVAVAVLARHLWLTHDPPKCRERLKVSSSALAISRGDSRPFTQLLIRRERLADLLAVGDVDAFDAALDDYEAAAAAAASARDIYWAMALRATQEAVRGDLGLAEQLARGALLRGRELIPDAFGAEYLQRFVLRYQQGRLREFVHDPGAADVDPTDLQPAYRAGSALDAIACVETGHPDLAVRRARWALGPAGDSIQRDVLWLGAHALLCGVAARANDVELARQLDDLIAPCSEQIVLFGVGGAVLGPVHYWQGLVAATALDTDRAEQHLDEAIRVARGLRAPFWVAQAQLDLAELLARPGGAASDDAIRRLTDESVAAAERFGFGRILEQAKRA